MTASTTTASPTVGMQIDAFLAQLDNMSSTQLYALIVGLTVWISFILLGSAPAGSDLPPTEQRTTTTTTRNSQTSKQQRSSAAGPEPRWHIFRWLNYAIVAAFSWSVAEFLLHASTYWHASDHSLLRFLLGWSVFLFYFFGFFGVSFVHDELLLSNCADASEEDSEQTSGPPQEHNTVSSKQQPLLKSKKKSALHPPAASTPVCSDPASVACTTTTIAAATNTTIIKSSTATTNLQDCSDDEIAQLVLQNKVKDHELEKRLDAHRAVAVRRCVVQHKLNSLGIDKAALQGLPYKDALDYSRVYGANCEIVVGFVPLPTGLIGPLTLNDETVYVPMATTEGCLVASTNRGAKAITAGGGAHAVIVRDGITRAPCVRMASAREAAALKLWCERPENFALLKAAFESTTSFGKLQSCVPTVAGKNVYLRLTCFAGDAMGMNMVSKGSLAVIECLQSHFSSLKLVALSGNMCTDKKAAATNWLEGRGKSVVVEATVPKDIVRTVLKTSVQAMVETNLHKNLIGSAMAATIGGFNAHASNIVTAVFLATGQDPAQNVESSNCITLLEETEDGDLWISCTMPSLEVGTVGGGTSLEAQSACLQAIGCKGGGKTPGENAQKLAKVVAAATMAGELSLLAALAANTLVHAHMQHNRKKTSSKK